MRTDEAMYVIDDLSTVTGAGVAAFPAPGDGIVGAVVLAGVADAAWLAFTGAHALVHAVTGKKGSTK